MVTNVVFRFCFVTRSYNQINRNKKNKISCNLGFKHISPRLPQHQVDMQGNNSDSLCDQRRFGVYFKVTIHCKSKLNKHDLQDMESKWEISNSTTGAKK